MLKIDISKCTGCRRCETACAFFHTGRVNPRLSRIKVLHLYESGIDGPVVCLQCRERYCLRCPESALTLGKKGQIVCSPTLCSLCGACEKLCPIGAVEIFQELVYVCDLCGGRPRCVEACTEGAIIYLPEKTGVESLASREKKSRGKTPAVKRLGYIQSLALKVREKWSRPHA